MNKIVHFITSLEIGGAQTVLHDLVLHFKKRNVEQHIIFIHDGPYRTMFQQMEIPIHQLNGFVSSYDLIALYRLVAHLKKIQPDCIHTLLWSANWFGRIAGKLTGIPCINTLHNNLDQNGRLRTILDALSPSPNQLIAVSSEVHESYRRFHRIRCPITVIPNGVDGNKIQALSLKNRISRADLGYTEENIIIGSVGRFHPVKRYPLLLETFKLLHLENPVTRLLIIGSGTEEPKLREKATQLGIEKYVTFATNQRAYGYYPIMDLFILASEKEGISIALLEAMSCAIPPVISYHSIHHPVINHGKNGYVAKTAEATHFARVAQPLVSDRALRKSIGTNAQRTVSQSFSIHAMAASYEKIFHTQC